MRIRYELLREARILPELNHWSTGGAIIKSLRSKEAKKFRYSSFIPPWFETYSDKTITLGWGEVQYGEQVKGIYIVEREVPDAVFSVRAMLLTEDGLISKSRNTDLPCSEWEEDYCILAKGLSFKDAYAFYKELTNKPLKNCHFDIINEEFKSIRNPSLYLGKAGSLRLTTLTKDTDENI